MITIQTRQNCNGLWWCNTTVNGIDKYTEGETVMLAQAQMKVFLREQKVDDNNLNWDAPKTYPYQHKNRKKMIPFLRKLDNL